MVPSNLQRFAGVLVFLVAITACAASPWKQEQANTHLDIGIAYLGSERFNDALKEFLKAADFTPRDSRVHYYMGIAYYRKGLTDKAIHEFSEAVSLNPDYAEAHNFLGTVYLAMGQWDKAIDAFKKALSNIMYETPDKALFNMGRAYYGKGEYRMALNQFAEAKIKKPNTVPMPLLDHHMGMASYADGNYYQAFQYFRKTIEQAPSFLESRYWLGHCYIKMQYPDRAKEEFKSIIKAAPESELAAEARKSLDSMNVPPGRP
ncbi:MAG: tetratricopeptide repeat protein [Deltaproteobacteria bacterium]|nr:tetratricopeptide repeat protein [Deltaproteobacteria bacterium]